MLTSSAMMTTHQIQSFFSFTVFCSLYDFDDIIIHLHSAGVKGSFY